jgi:hypothetical protein
MNLFLLFIYESRHLVKGSIMMRLIFAKLFSCFLFSTGRVMDCGRCSAVWRWVFDKTVAVVDAWDAPCSI